MKMLELKDAVCSVINEDLCIACGSCARECPEGVITVGSPAVQEMAKTKSGRPGHEKPISDHHTPILDPIMDQLAGLQPVQDYRWKGKDIRSFDSFEVEGRKSYVRVYRANKLDKIGVACIDFHGLMTANVITVAPGPEYDIPYYGFDWDESADHIFFYCDLLPTDDVARNPDYLRSYLYEPLEEYYQTYCHLPGLKNSPYHWARAMYSPYVLTGIIDKADKKALGMLYSLTRDYLRAWITVWKNAVPHDPGSSYMRLVHEKQKQIHTLLHTNDPGGPPLYKLVGRETAETFLDIVLP
jgi:ferredoxin